MSLALQPETTADCPVFIAARAIHGRFVILGWCRRVTDLNYWELHEWLVGRSITPVNWLDGSPHRSGLAQALHRQLQLTNVNYTVGLFGDVLPGTLERPVDFAFIDGNHACEPTLPLA